MMKDLVRSLCKDKVRTISCWMTFVLTSMYIFLFFTVAMSDAIGVTVVEGVSNIPSILMVVAVVLCSVEILFANDFFIKTKSKELAIRYICGSTYTKNAFFLLLQTILILLCAFPLGIFFGFCLLPGVNWILEHQMHSSFVITLNSNSLFWSFAVILYVIFWTLLANLSFSYRNSVAMLLNPISLKVPNVLNLSKKTDKKDHIFKILHVVLWLVPILIAYWNPNMMLVCVIVSLFGFVNILNDFILPYLEDRIHANMDKEVKLLSLGYLRYDLKLLKMNCLMYIISAAVLCSLLSQSEDLSNQVLVLITYIAMNILLALSILFKFANEITERPNKFKTLNQLGFSLPSQKQIVFVETSLFYLFLIAITSFYLLNIFGAFIQNGTIAPHYAFVLFGGSVIPLVICALLTMVYYAATVLKKA